MGIIVKNSILPVGTLPNARDCCKTIAATSLQKPCYGVVHAVRHLQQPSPCAGASRTIAAVVIAGDRLICLFAVINITPAESTGIFITAAEIYIFHLHRPVVILVQVVITAYRLRSFHLLHTSDRCATVDGRSSTTHTYG